MIDTPITEVIPIYIRRAGSHPDLLSVYVRSRVWHHRMDRYIAYGGAAAIRCLCAVAHHLIHEVFVTDNESDIH
jgi:hypothetical protein